MLNLVLVDGRHLLDLKALRDGECKTAGQQLR
jgi:hypothetical protein